ncbi:MAG: hypothetical protein AB1499_17185 [Nitrospirota bacterium]
MISAWFLLSRLKRVTRENITVWIIFMILIVGYYMKFYYFVRGFILGENIVETAVLMGEYAASFASPELLLDCFTSISLSFVLFAVIACYILRGPQETAGSTRSYGRKIFWKRRCHIALSVACILAVISGFLRWFFNLDLPGEAVILPYKIAGITTITNTHITSFLLGLALIYAIRSDERKVVRYSIIFFLSWGAIHYFLFGSKLFLVMPMLWIILIGLWEKRTLIQMRYVVGFGSLFVILYPFLNLVRVARREGTSEGLLLYVMEAIMGIDGTGQFAGSLSAVSFGLLGLMSRIVGLDSMMILAALKPGFDDIGLGSILGGQSEHLLTTYILRWDNETGIAQSLLGQAYFHTGSAVLTAILIGAWTVFTYQVARGLYKINTSFSQTLWVTWIASVLQWTSDGFTSTKMFMFLVSALPIYFIISIIEGKLSRITVGAVGTVK